jgi:plastocyanin
VSIAYALAAAGALAGLAPTLACGGSSSSPTVPSTPPVATNTITILRGGVSPKDITVGPGTQVTFVNSDTASHNVTSDPHPEHTDCPEINQVGFLNPNQIRQTGNLNTIRVCGYHDHDDAQNSKWKGTITIQ